MSVMQPSILTRLVPLRSQTVSRRTHVAPGWTALTCCALLALPLSGCTRIKQKMQQSVDNDPNMRQTAINGARQSCVQTASSKLPNTPGMSTRVNNYCDCAANKTINQFTNSQLVSMGLRGGKLTAEDQAKLDRAVEMCQSALTAPGQ